MDSLSTEMIICLNDYNNNPLGLFELIHVGDLVLLEGCEIPSVVLYKNDNRRYIVVPGERGYPHHGDIDSYLLWYI